MPVDHFTCSRRGSVRSVDHQRLAASPRRRYAVVRLALDLGLRSIEISRLQLADIDWRLGTVTLKRTKSRRQDLLPLPVVAGRALDAYLRHERPETSDTAVFVCRLMLHDEPIGSHAARR